MKWSLERGYYEEEEPVQSSFKIPEYSGSPLLLSQPDDSDIITDDDFKKKNKYTYQFNPSKGMVQVARPEEELNSMLEDYNKRMYPVKEETTWTQDLKNTVAEIGGGAVSNFVNWFKESLGASPANDGFADSSYTPSEAEFINQYVGTGKEFNAGQIASNAAYRLGAGVATANEQLLNIPRMIQKGSTLLPGYDESQNPIATGLNKGVEYYKNLAEENRSKIKNEGALGETFGQALEAIPPLITSAVLGAGIGGKIATAGLTAMEGNTARTLAQNLGERIAPMLPFGAVAGSGYAKEAEEEGANYIQQVLYGLSGGTSEIATELIPFEQAKGLFKGIKAKTLIKDGAKNFIDKYGKAGAKYLATVISEAVQEAAVDPMTAAAKKAIYKPDEKLFDTKQMTQDAAGGAAMAVLLSALGLPAAHLARRKAESVIENGEPVTNETAKEIQTLMLESPGKEANATWNNNGTQEDVTIIDSYDKDGIKYYQDKFNRSIPETELQFKGAKIIGQNITEKKKQQDELSAKREQNRINKGYQDTYNAYSDNQKSIFNRLKVPGESIEGVKKEAEQTIKKLVTEEFNHLKSTAGKGVTQGMIIKDKEGNVVDRIGRTSKNPEWYRQYFKENGHAPNNKELYDLAVKRLSEGYREEGQDIPPDSAYLEAQETLKSLPAIDSDIKSGKIKLVKSMLSEDMQEAAISVMEDEVPFKSFTADLRGFGKVTVNNIKNDRVVFTDFLGRKQDIKVSQFERLGGVISGENNKSASSKVSETVGNGNTYDKKDGKKDMGPKTDGGSINSRDDIEEAFNSGIQGTKENAGKDIKASIRKPKTKTEKALVKFMRGLGVDVVYYESDSSFEDEFVSARNGSIIFVKEGGQESTTFYAGHGFMHTIRMNHPDLYKQLAEVYKKTVTQAQIEKYKSKLGGENQTEEQKKAYRDKMTDDAIIEEMLSDESGNLFTDKTFWQDVYNKSKELFDKLVKVINNLFKEVKYANVDNYLTKNQIDRFRVEFNRTITKIRERAEKGIQPNAFDDPNNPISYSVSRAKVEEASYRGYLTSNGRTIISSLERIADIDSRIMNWITSSENKGRKQQNVRAYERYLKSHTEDMKALVDIMNESNRKGVATDFITSEGALKKLPAEMVERTEKPKLTKEQKDKYTWVDEYKSLIEKNTGEKVYKFDAWMRKLPQMYLDSLNHRDFEELRKSLVKATEDSYNDIIKGRKPEDKTRLGGFTKIFGKGDIGARLTDQGISLDQNEYRVNAPLRHAHKTVGSLSLNSACPMFTIGNNGCYLDACYLTQMAQGAIGTALYEKTMYTGEILQLSKDEIRRLNQAGGIRMNGVGDTTLSTAAQFADAIKHAGMVGLKIKIITKQAETFKALREAKKQGISLKHVQVQPSMDNMWIQAEMDFRSMSGVNDLGINKSVEAGRLEAAANAYKELFGRETMIKDGKLYRKYGFSRRQIAEFENEFPDIRILPRYVVTTATEIADIALKEPWAIQTLMHGKVPADVYSEYMSDRPEGQVLNFGNPRHSIMKVNGKWRFRGWEKHKLVASTPHLIVEEYIGKLPKADQDKIWKVLEKSMCCQEGASDDACLDCAGHNGICALGQVANKPYMKMFDLQETARVYDDVMEEAAITSDDTVYSAREKETRSPEFKAWFGKSKVVDDKGEPLVVYHGSGTAITEFKPEFTGQGNDQIGSGFYFTTDKTEADAYTSRELPGVPKLGGTDNPSVVSAYLSIKNPIVIQGSNLNDSDINLTKKQAYEIMKKSPKIMDKEESPLGDWIDSYWEVGPKDWMIKKVAESYAGSSLISLENDFFKGHSTEFREALNDVLKYDGVVQEFGNGKKHYVAWFPTQIKSVDNTGIFDPNNPDIRYSARDKKQRRIDRSPVRLEDFAEYIPSSLFVQRPVEGTFYRGQTIGDKEVFKNNGGSRYGKGKYYASSKRAAEIYAEYRENGEVIKKDVRLEKPFVDYLPDTTTPEWQKLTELLKEHGLSDGQIRYITNPNVRDTPFVTIRKFLKNENDEKGFWIGSDKVNKLLREAGYDGIVGYMSGDPDFPNHVEVVVFDGVSYSARDKEKRNIDTPEFKKWFGKSKVVDAEGKPLTVWHGTDYDFNVFKTSNMWGYGGTYFSSNENVAKAYTKKGKVVPAYVSLQNPFIVDANNKRYDVIDRPKEMNGKGLVDTQEIVAFARDNGYDGVIVKNVIENGGLADDIVAFEPTQIKSVYNTGTWDSNNPDIRYASRSVTRRNDTQNGERYFRYTTKDNPMSNWGHAMFAAQSSRIYNGGEPPVDENSGKTYYWEVNGKDLIPIRNLKNEIIEKWEYDRENGFTGDFGNGATDDYWYSISGEDIYKSFNPDDIVDSADAYDSELIQWLWNRILEPNDIKGVTTRDGAVVFNDEDNIIKKYYDPKTKYSSRSMSRRNQTQLIDVAASAKDISGLKAYGTDIYRIFRDVFKGNEKWAKDKYLDTLDAAKLGWVETQEKYIKELKENVTDKGISQDSKLSKLVQLYGEKKIDLDELKRRTNKYQDVVNAADWFKRTYKELLTRINEVRAEIYPNNPDKIIPERKDYFRHFTEIAEGIEGLKNSFDTPANIDPQLVGTSEYTKPRAKWESIFQERKGDKTKVDAVGGFLDYLPAASYAINIDPMISMFEGLEQELKDATAESKHLNNFIQFLDDYAKDLAGKTNPMGDRALQKLIGRRGMRILSWMNGRIKGNLVLGNISSIVSQVANVPNGMAKVKNPVHLTEGLVDTVKALFNSNDAVKQSGFLKERYMDKNYRQFDTKLIHQPKKFLAWLMEGSDWIGTNYVWNSLYRNAQAKGNENPVKYADDETRKLVAGRGIGEVPLLQKSKVFQMVAPMQLEVANLWNVQKDFIKDKDLGGIILLWVLLRMFNYGMEQVRGSGVTFDPLKALYDVTLSDKAGDMSLVQKGGRIAGEVLGNIPMGNQVAALLDEKQRQDFFGKDDPARFGTGIITAKGFQDPGYKLLAPYAGGQVKKTIEGITAQKKGGVYTKDGKLQYPVDKEDILRLALFGKSSTKQAMQYYDSEAMPLSEKQTMEYEKQVKRGTPFEQAYSKIIRDREINSINDKIKEVSNDKKLTRQQRIEQTQKLKERLSKLKAAR